MANASLFYRKNPHFFQPLLPDFQSSLNIPVKFFSDHITGKHEGKIVTLRSDASEKTWKVKMEGQRLTQGWKEFVESHDLRIGDFVVFRHEGDMLFHVTALGPSCCEIQYSSSCSHDKDQEENNEIETSSRSEEILTTNCFSQSVTASNLSRDSVGVPIDFAKRHSLNKRSQEIALMNEEGESWTSELMIDMSCRVYIVRGWRSFCTANDLEVGDSCAFTLLLNKETPVFQLCSRMKANRKKKIQSVEENIDYKTGENRFVKLTPTPNSLEIGKQMEESPLEAEALAQKRARVQKWSQEKRMKHEVSEKIAAEVEEPSHRTRASNKSCANQGNLRTTQPCSVSDKVIKVKQSILDTLNSIKLFLDELETMEQKLEDSLQGINNLVCVSTQSGEDNG